MLLVKRIPKVIFLKETHLSESRTVLHDYERLSNIAQNVHAKSKNGKSNRTAAEPESAKVQRSQKIIESPLANAIYEVF